MKHTYIVYINNNLKFVDNGKFYDFFRVSCKRVTTVFKYLKNWIKQADEGKGLNILFRKIFFYPEATYSIVDYYGNIVAEGYIKDIYKPLSEVYTDI